VPFFLTSYLSSDARMETALSLKHQVSSAAAALASPLTGELASSEADESRSGGKGANDPG